MGWITRNSRRFLGVAALALAALAGGAAAAQDIDPNALSVSVADVTAAAGASGEIRVKFELVPEHHVYGHDHEMVPTVVHPPAVPGVTFGTPVYPKAHVVERWGEQSRELDGEFVVTVPFTVAADAAAGPHQASVTIDYQVCNSQMCLDAVKGEAHTFMLTITAGAAAPAPAKPVAPAKPPTKRIPGGLPPLGGGDPDDARLSIDDVAADATGVTFTVTPHPEGWHIGPVHVPDGAVSAPTKFQFTGATVNGPIEEPAPTLKKEHGLVSAFHAGTVKLRVPLAYDAGATEVRGHITFQICSQVCVDGDVAFTFAVPAATAQAPAGKPAQPAQPETPPTAPDDDDLTKLSFPGFLLACIGGGLFSLIMPCVYPLIPITVTFFAKQAGEDGQGKTMGLAVMYGLGIVTTFTGLGAVLTLALGETGATVFASNPWVNTVVAAVFFYFTLALFGLVPLDLPASWKNKLSGGAPKKGFLGAFVLGLVFTVVTFTCVIPIAGGLMIVAAKEGFLYGTFGMLVYSTTMAIPFLLLGLFPAAVRKMPMGGGWLHTVKMTGGFIELALVVYYWTKADQGFFGADVLVSHDMALAVYVVACLAVGTYLFGMWRTPEDGDVKAVGVPRMLFAFLFCTFGVFMASGLAGKDLGVLEALLPLQEPGAGMIATNTDGGSGSATVAAPARVYDEFDEGMAVARREGKPAFVEFTGFT